MPRHLRTAILGGSGLPQASAIIFALDPENSLTPTIGSAGSFARASSIYYASSVSQFTQATSGNAARPATIYGVGSGLGVQIQGARKNLIPNSDQINTTGGWADVGAVPTVQNYAGTGSPFVGISNSTQLTANGAGNGKRWDSGILAASKTFVARLFVRSVFGGNTSGKLSINGTGGTPEQVDVAWSTGTSTTVWTEVLASKVFTAGATGNAGIQITIDTNANTALLVGAMFEQADDATNGSTLLTSSFPILTSGAAAVSVLDNLNYPSTSLNANKGTYTTWITPLWASGQVTSANPKYVFSTRAGAGDIRIHMDNTPQWQLTYMSQAVTTTAVSFSRGTPQMLGVDWNASGGNATLNIYYNGVFKQTVTGATAAAVAGTLQLGGRVDLNNAQSGEIILGKQRSWDNVVLSSAEHAQVFSAQRGGYGV